MADMVHGEEEGGQEWSEEERDDEGGEEEEGSEEDREVIDNEEEEEKGGDEEGIRERENDETEVAENTEEYEKTLDTTQKNTCRYCHQPGHKERKCPVLHPELQKVPRMKPKKDVTELEIRDRVGTRERYKVDSTRT